MKSLRPDYSRLADYNEFERTFSSFSIAKISNSEISFSYQRVARTRYDTIHSNKCDIMRTCLITYDKLYFKREREMTNRNFLPTFMSLVGNEARTTCVFVINV